MLRSITRFLLVVGVALIGTSSATSAEWGDLKGVFVLDGPAPPAPPVNVNKDEAFCGQHALVDESLVVGADGGLANVVVYVRGNVDQVHPDLESGAPAELMFDNKNCRFEPHILPLWIGKQTLLLHNSDPVGHNSNLQPLGDVGINPLLPAGGELRHQFNRRQNIPVPVACNIHPWMKGYVLPRDNPYTAVSAADGSFQIEKLPAGEHEFQVWQEKAGYVDPGDWPRGRFTLTIGPGANDLGTIKLKPAIFEK